MKLKAPHCPTCGQAAIGTHELIDGHACLEIDNDGRAEFTGCTETWNDSETVRDAEGRVELVCPEFHAWFSDDLDSPTLLQGDRP